MTAPRWSVEGRGWPNRAHSCFVEAGRLRWHVQVRPHDDPAAPALLLIHGTGAATHSWRDLAPLLARRFTIVAPDLPGHGFTTGRLAGGMTMRAMARALAELLARLDIAPAMIVGHSAGAAIAIRMTLDDAMQPAGIVGLNAALLPFPGLAARLFPAMARLLFVNPLAPHVFAGMARRPGEVARFLRTSTGSRIDPILIDFYARLFATSGHCAGAITMMAGWNLDAFARDLPGLAVPLLLAHGTADAAIPLATAERAAAVVRAGRLVTLPELGHLAHEERPAEIAALITDFAAALAL